MLHCGRYSIDAKGEELVAEEIKSCTVVFQAALLAALVALACAIIMGFFIRSPAGIDTLQPSVPAVATSEFLEPINRHPDVMLRFFSADSLFIISYLMVFVGLYATVVTRSPTYAVIGMGAGILAALLDATENAYFISYARLAQDGVAVKDPALPLVFVIGNLKWMSAYVTLVAFGLVWPRHDWLGWVISVLMLLFPVVGVLGVVWSSLIPLRGLFFLAGFALFAWHFWREARQRT
jgi:hypothetical protein